HRPERPELARRLAVLRPHSQPGGALRRRAGRRARIPGRDAAEVSDDEVAANAFSSGSLETAPIYRPAVTLHFVSLNCGQVAARLLNAFASRRRSRGPRGPSATCRSPPAR
nr:hypothetical protein [Tanacetum cinerariifolium]